MSNSQKKLYKLAEKNALRTDSYVAGAMYVNNIYVSTLMNLFGRKTGLAIADSIINNFFKEIKDMKPIKKKKKSKAGSR